ncbi:MAG: LytR C-terminal domain-containing protein [Pseudonocardiaceae bacterium]
MSTPDATGSGRPLRTAGLALLGVAALSLIIGLVSLVVGGNGAPTAGQAPSGPAATTTAGPGIPDGATATATSQAPTPPSSPARPGATAVPRPGVPGPGVPGPGVPGTGTDVGAGIGGGKGEIRAAVRVYNNSTIRGLAAQAADDLTAAGWPVIEVGNYSAGRIPTTTVYYEPGTGQQDPAEQIGQQFGMRVEPRFAGIRDASPGVIVIVTNDYAA